MRNATVEYTVYNYNELSDKAKEKVKEEFLQYARTESIFTEDCKQDLDNLFGENNLDVQYSLAYCQGDGFNIYGSIEAYKIIDCLDDRNGGTQLEDFYDLLTDKEVRTILNYAEECGDIQLPCNNRYCYSLADRIDIAEDWEYQLEVYSGYENINTEVLKKFEKIVRGIFSELCGNYEKQGYEYFYSISDEEMEEYCEMNNWEFLVDGSIFG